MLLVTVGTQLPFDRLINAVDAWAKNNPQEEVFAQIGSTKSNPKHLNFASKVNPDEFKTLVSRSDLIIAHAGMGSILAGLEHSKPVIIVPRLAVFGEHRNDHQLATITKFAHIPQIYPAEPSNLACIINKVKYEEFQSRSFSAHASKELIRCIKNFVEV
jgi:UDP-N-acetylglucosamine transferase subunit ALG13